MVLDIAFVAAQAASALAPALPVLFQKVGGAAAANIISKLGEESWKRAQSLWNTLQPNVDADPVAQGLAARMADDPTSERMQAAFAVALEELLNNDEALRSQVAAFVQPSEQQRGAVTASGSRAVAIGGSFSGGGSIITGSNNTQVRDISGSQGVVFGSGSANVTQSSQFDAKALAAALLELHTELGMAQLPARTQLQAQTAAGTAALEADPEVGDVDADAVADKVKQIGTVMQEAGAVIDKGSSLWGTVQKVATVLGPLVGGAQTVMSWFGAGS